MRNQCLHNPHSRDRRVLCVCVCFAARGCARALPGQVHPPPPELGGLRDERLPPQQQGRDVLLAAQKGGQPRHLEDIPERADAGMVYASACCVACLCVLLRLFGEVVPVAHTPMHVYRFAYAYARETHVGRLVCDRSIVPRRNWHTHSSLTLVRRSVLRK